MLIPRLHTLVSLMIIATITIKLSQDIYKTITLHKNRKGVLELNWPISKWVHKKVHVYSALLRRFG